jgi:hypothetical protein
MKRFLLLFSFLLLSCSSSKPTDAEMSAADYGTPPANHVDLIKHWMEETYGNTQSAGIRDLKFGTPVKGYHMPSALESGGPKFGYEVEVNFSRSATEGRRTTRQRVMVLVLIRNDVIVSYKERNQ